jgi:DNA invertase Pin-like site-specific DNA recombinase
VTLKIRRCAVYTRKSTEEGLDQAFNSLDAQREACEAYIKSQAHEGWKPVKAAYDDGGFSGGNMDRPALQRLMADLKQGLVDVIVVYKVDRLTRSLADFAKIVETLDGHGASFVSVTQQFNTTTSMGRLTLNVLLSFAQFEREVTGERIRDKIAASKRKGMWVGGTPPTGYDIRDRQLVVNEAEAETVRSIYRRYLQLGCVTALADDLQKRGIVTRIRVSRRGNAHGGQPFGRGALYHLLQNQLYLGMIVHKGQIHPGQHRAVVPQNLWDRVQVALQANRVDRKPGARMKPAALLVGLLRDDRGSLMVPTQTHKANGQRYRYYISQSLARGGTAGGGRQRVSAGAIEDLVVGEILRRLPKAKQEAWASAMPTERAGRLREMIASVGIGTDAVEIRLTEDGVKELTAVGAPKVNRAAKSIRVQTRLIASASGKAIVISDYAVAQRGRLDRALLRAVARANHWREMLESGMARSAYDLARHEKCRISYVQRHLPLAFLPPSLVEQILEGRQPRSCSLASLVRTGSRALVVLGTRRSLVNPSYGKCGPSVLRSR